MRLLHVETLQLESFEPPEVPAYAILSHRWEEEEYLYADNQARINQHKKGFRKILWTCQQARANRLQYVWIDTCCIDKSSSAELSEAVNSMFTWYQDASECYAYISDVSSESMSLGNINHLSSFRAFSESLWFSRGWTLQELIAPTRMWFFGHQWHPLGRRDDLLSDICHVTRIDRNLLIHDREPLKFRLSKFSAAQKMSWAAKRRTTRVEDRAYSLLGLFGVNMPLLYGEGRKAFVRLQEEILKAGTDLSILAWRHYDSLAMDRKELLATEPDYFFDCHDIIHSPLLDDTVASGSTFTTTSLGLTINKPLIVHVSKDSLPGALWTVSGRAWAVSLECRRIDDILNVLVLGIEPLQPVEPPQSITHSSQRLEYTDQSAPVSWSQPNAHSSSRAILCYSGWEHHRQRVHQVNFLEPAILPDWENLTLLRHASILRGNHVQSALTHSHIWLRTPDDGQRPAWVVQKLLPSNKWNSSSLTFDLGWDHSNGYGLGRHSSKEDGYAAAVLVDPTTSLAVIVHMNQRRSWHWRYVKGLAESDPHPNPVLVAIEKFDPKTTTEQSPFRKRYSSSSILDITEHLRVEAVVKDIKRAGLLIAQVVVTVSPDVFKPHEAPVGQDNTPQELEALPVDASFFQSNLNKAENQANVQGRFEKQKTRYVELLRTEEEKATTRQKAKEASQDLSIRWMDAHMEECDYMSSRTPWFSYSHDQCLQG